MKLLTRFMLPCLILSALLIACENPNNVTTPDAKTPSEAEKSKSAITDLSDLTVSEGTLTPTFNASITSYTVEVPSSVSTIKVTGKLKDSKAKISTNNGTNTTVEVGETVIKLEVTAENGTDKKSYVVTVSKTQTTVTNPEYVSENIGTLKPIYPGKFQYDKTTTNIAEITKPYRIGEKEITRKQFKDIMGTDPSTYTKTDIDTYDDYPVENVSFFAAIVFCNKLSIKEELTPVYSVDGFDFEAYTYKVDNTSNYWYEQLKWETLTCNWDANGYRLPTSMEWTWAAMGTGVKQNKTDYIDTTSWKKQYAGHNLAEKYPEPIDYYAVRKPVGYGEPLQKGCTKKPNEASLYDMTGNVFEWVWDIDGKIPEGNLTDCKGFESTDLTLNRLLRGGDSLSAINDTGVGRIFSNRPWTSEGTQGRHQWVGFRVAKN